MPALEESSSGPPYPETREILLKPASHTPKVLRLDRSVVRVEDSASRDEHDVDRVAHAAGPLFAEDFPQEPLRAVSLDRAPDLPAGDETDPQPAFLRARERRPRRGGSPIVVLLDKRARSPPGGAGREVGPAISSGSALRQTERRCRPLRRRRASTARPAFDRILTRKPCVRLRRRRFGWNVLFISS